MKGVSGAGKKQENGGLCYNEDAYIQRFNLVALPHLVLAGEAAHNINMTQEMTFHGKHTV